MQARSSYQPSYNTLRRPSYPLIPLRQSTHRPVSPPSPIARYYPLDGNRRSVCELVIPEEVQGPSSDLSATLHSHIDLSLEFLKRRHKPKSTLSRTASEPQILSTNTTQPVYIPNSPYVSLLHLVLVLTSPQHNGYSQPTRFPCPRSRQQPHRLQNCHHRRCRQGHAQRDQPSRRHRRGPHHQKGTFPPPTRHPLTD